MPVVTQRSFLADMAANLDRLEVGAAVVERDAQRGRARLSELGLDRSRRRSATTIYAAQLAGTIGLQVFAPACKAARAVLAAILRAARSPRVGVALQNAASFLVQAVVFFSLSCAVLLAFVAAILVLAPPD